MTVDALVWIPRMMYPLRRAEQGAAQQWFTATVLLRDMAVIGLVVLVIRQIYRPAEDLVCWGGRIDDPAGGVFERAPDAFPKWWPARLRPAEQRREASDARRHRPVPA